MGGAETHHNRSLTEMRTKDITPLIGTTFICQVTYLHSTGEGGKKKDGKELSIPKTLPKV
jgi:hypothetical protein